MTSDQSRTEARAEEAAAIRRRWLTLGEILAVLAIIISALTLWLNWSERSESQQQKVAETKSAARRSAIFTLGGQPSEKGARLDLRPVSTEQHVLSQVIRFPAALDVDPVETTGDPRIEARWFEDALKKARSRAGLPDESRGDERLPLIISTRFVIDGQNHEDVALYDLGYTVKGRMLSGHVVTLRGLSLVKRVKAAAAQGELGARSSRLFVPRGA